MKIQFYSSFSSAVNSISRFETFINRTHKMCSKTIFLTCIIVIYAIFTVYETTMIAIFLLSMQHMEQSFIMTESIKIICEYLCSFFLIIGALLSKSVLMILSLVILIVKFCIFTSEILNIYRRTLGCNENEITQNIQMCEPDKTVTFYTEISKYGM